MFFHFDYRKLFVYLHSKGFLYKVSKIVWFLFFYYEFSIYLPYFHTNINRYFILNKGRLRRTWQAKLFKIIVIVIQGQISSKQVNIIVIALYTLNPTYNYFFIKIKFLRIWILVSLICFVKNYSSITIMLTRFFHITSNILIYFLLSL